MIFDRAIYDQVVRLLGAATASDFLRMLLKRLYELGPVPEDAAPSAASLMRLHQIASEAGLMGFLELSQACKAYENAWSSDLATVDANQSRRLNILVDDHIKTITALLSQGRFES